MSDQRTREQRRRSIITRDLHSSKYRIRTVNPKKTEYKRQRKEEILREIEEEEDEWNT